MAGIDTTLLVGCLIMSLLHEDKDRVWWAATWLALGCWVIFVGLTT